MKVTGHSFRGEECSLLELLRVVQPSFKSLKKSRPSLQRLMRCSACPNQILNGQPQMRDSWPFPQKVVDHSLASFDNIYIRYKSHLLKGEFVTTVPPKCKFVKPFLCSIWFAYYYHKRVQTSDH
jgi:hypothetical protein